MRKSRKQRGLSLLEMSAASIVVAVALLGTTAAVVSGASLSAEVTRMRAAQRAATTVMEEVRATDFADLVSTYEDARINVADHEKGIDDGVATVSVQRVSNGSSTELVYEVTVSVSFDGAGGNQTHPIVTYVSDRVAGNSMNVPTQVEPDEETQPEQQSTQEPPPGESQ